MRYRVRSVRMEDAAAVTRVLQTVEWFSPPADEPIRETEALVARQLELCLADDSHSVYVAEDPGGEIAGYVVVHWLPYPVARGSEGYVSDLFVADAARGQGIGTRLLEEVESEARRRGCKRLMLLNGRESECYRREFYTKRGWIERREIANFTFLPSGPEP